MVGGVWGGGVWGWGGVGSARGRTRRRRGDGTVKNVPAKLAITMLRLVEQGVDGIIV